MSGSRARPPVSVVIPFRGGRRDAERLRSRPAILSRRRGDEVIIADNSDDGSAARAAPRPGWSGIELAPGAAPRPGWSGAERAPRIVRAAAERSSYHARNAGARAARNQWILFLDADCSPGPGLIDAFFASPIPARCGALAGQILGDPDQRSIAARYARSRRLFDHSNGLIRAGDGGAAAGNLLVRREAFEAVGGFAEGVRSGGDLDLCRRLRLAGWELGYRPNALVHHRHRATLPSLLGAFARYGAGARWLNERHPGCSPRWRLASGLGAVARDAWGAALRRRWRAALYRAIDGLGLIAHNLGYMSGNRARPGTARR